MSTVSLTRVLIDFQTAFNLGRGTLLNESLALFTVLATLEVAFAGLYLAFGSTAEHSKVAKRVVVMGLLFWIINNYSILAEEVLKGFLHIGETAADGASVNFETFKNPDAIFHYGVKAVEPAFIAIAVRSATSYLGLPSLDDIFLTICIILTLAAFGIMAIQVFVVYLEYMIISSLGLALVPLAVFKPVQNIGEKVFGAIISFGIKLMILSFLIGACGHVMGALAMSEQVTSREAVDLVFISFALMGLCFHAPGVVAGLLNGSPALSAGLFATGAKSVAAVAAPAAVAAGAGFRGVTSTAKAAGHIGGGAVGGAWAAGMGQGKSTQASGDSSSGANTNKMTSPPGMGGESSSASSASNASQAGTNSEGATKPGMAARATGAVRGAGAAAADLFRASRRESGVGVRAGVARGIEAVTRKRSADASENSSKDSSNKATGSRLTKNAASYSSNPANEDVSTSGNKVA